MTERLQSTVSPCAACWRKPGSDRLKLSGLRSTNPGLPGKGKKVKTLKKQTKIQKGDLTPTPAVVVTTAESKTCALILKGKDRSKSERRNPVVRTCAPALAAQLSALTSESGTATTAVTTMADGVEGEEGVEAPEGADDKVEDDYDDRELTSRPKAVLEPDRAFDRDRLVSEAEADGHRDEADKFEAVVNPRDTAENQEDRDSALEEDGSDEADLVEMLQNAKLIERLDQTSGSVEGSVTDFLSNVKDDTLFQKLRLPSQSKPATDSVPSATVVPHLRTLKQLNLPRHVRRVEKLRYDELKKEGVGQGMHPFDRFKAITKQIIAELRETDPEKLAEYETYVAQHQEGKISEEMTEDERLKSAVKFYDLFAGKLSGGYAMNVWSVLVWRDKDGEPVFDLRQTRGWSLGTLEQRKRLQSLLLEMLDHQFSPEGQGMGLAEVDRTTPLPPPLPENLGGEKRDILEKAIRNWLYKVAVWQGGGLKQKSIPWLEMTKSDGPGPGHVFANHAECLPKGQALRPIDKMTLPFLRDWYQILLTLQREKRAPVVFVDSMLVESESSAGSGDSLVKRGNLDVDDLSDTDGEFDLDVNNNMDVDVNDDHAQPFLDKLLPLDPRFLDDATDKTSVTAGFLAGGLATSQAFPIDPFADASTNAGTSGTAGNNAETWPNDLFHQELPGWDFFEPKDFADSSLWDPDRLRNGSMVNSMAGMPDSRTDAEAQLPTLPRTWNYTTDKPESAVGAGTRGPEDSQLPFPSWDGVAHTNQAQGSLENDQTGGPSARAASSTLSDLTPPPPDDDFPTTPMSGRSRKRGPPTRISPGSPTKRASKASKRMKKALDARATEDNPVKTRSRTRDAPQPYPSQKTSQRASMFTWQCLEPLESIARESYLDKKYTDLPPDVVTDFKGAVTAVHELDEFLKAVDPQTFSIPEYSQAPPIINQWARGCNRGSFLRVGQKFWTENGETIDTWLAGLKFGKVDEMTDEEILGEIWFKPNGQGLSHVLWALRASLKGRKLKKESGRMPEFILATLNGIQKVVQRIRASEMILRKFKPTLTLSNGLGEKEGSSSVQ
ncbi:hypothetical protein K435DRAFT_867910 [Dendrothele bispora CBS 962.96]|uniref:Uncharacterized protein n=1 Tax=Dendrothele bispora (strain CBS 962.96) TaxID=1314807 RepID=A0A4S8LDT7_DENBC|nr:hypothetical protein K435DRAFT_867910 [Dendrothele bispora CBS 962.96]